MCTLDLFGASIETDIEKNEWLRVLREQRLMILARVFDIVHFKHVVQAMDLQMSDDGGD